MSSSEKQVLRLPHDRGMRPTEVRSTRRDKSSREAEPRSALSQPDPRVRTMWYVPYPTVPWPIRWEQVCWCHFSPSSCHSSPCPSCQGAPEMAISPGQLEWLFPGLVTAVSHVTGSGTPYFFTLCRWIVMGRKLQEEAQRGIPIHYPSLPGGLIFSGFRFLSCLKR